MGYRYAYLTARESYGGLRWEFEGKKYDEDLMEVLNIIGKQGWKIVCKDANYRYIMMVEGCKNV